LIGRAAPKAFGVGSRFKSQLGYHFSFFDQSNHPCAIYAICLMNEKDRTRILSAAASPDGTKVPDYKIHYTTDGTEPSARSPVYSRPVKNAPQLRAAILVNEEVVARADSRTSAPATSDSAVAIAKANAQRE